MCCIAFVNAALFSKTVSWYQVNCNTDNNVKYALELSFHFSSCIHIVVPLSGTTD